MTEYYQMWPQCKFIKLYWNQKGLGNKLALNQKEKEPVEIGAQRGESLDYLLKLPGEWNFQENN